jgi:acyl-CoA synthetase (AMP-forming)/AMP-acid ligase II
MSTIPDWLERNARETPAHVALQSVERNVVLTHEELFGLCCRVSKVLARRGIGANDRVAMIARNSPEHLVAYLGTMAHGATICTIEPDLTSDVAGLVQALEPSLVLYGSEEESLPVAGEAESLPLGRLGERDSGFCAELGGESAGALAPANTPADVASIFFTSGTEATPKGIVCTFAELEGNVEPTAQAFGVTQADRVLEFRSLNWMSAQLLGGLVPLCCGATLLLANGFSRSRFFTWIEQHRATIATGNPTTINMLLNRPVTIERDAIAQLRFVTSSSAPLLLEDWKAFEARYEIPIAQGYGSSETGWIAGSNERARREGSVGKPLPYHRLTIVDDAGEELPTGETGAVELGGSPDTRYRHLDSDGRVHVAATGRIRTGDTGHLDEDGFLFLSGRAKHLIIRGGINVSPVEIDAVIAQLPEVAEVLTVGVPDRIYGEEIVAYVAPRAGGTLDPSDVLGHCRTSLPQGKVPSQVIVRDSLPKTARGKPDRAALVAEWEQERAAD